MLGDLQDSPRRIRGDAVGRAQIDTLPRRRVRSRKGVHSVAQLGIQGGMPATSRPFDAVSNVGRRTWRRSIGRDSR